MAVRGAKALPEEQRAAFVRRLSEASERADLKSAIRLAEATGLDRRTIDRLKNGSRIPEPFTLAKIAEVLGVSSDWLLSGRAEVAASGPDLTQALPGFLYELQDSGLANWAARPPAGVQPPTIAEALRALRFYADERASGKPTFTSEGERSMRWAEYFANVRAGKAPPVASVRSTRRTMDADEAERRVPIAGVGLVAPKRSPAKG